MNCHDIMTSVTMANSHYDYQINCSLSVVNGMELAPSFMSVSELFTISSRGFNEYYVNHVYMAVLCTVTVDNSSSILVATVDFRKHIKVSSVSLILCWDQTSKCKINSATTYINNGNLCWTFYSSFLSILSHIHFWSKGKILFTAMFTCCSHVFKCTFVQ